MHNLWKRSLAFGERKIDGGTVHWGVFGTTEKSDYHLNGDGCSRIDRDENLGSRRIIDSSIALSPI